MTDGINNNDGYYNDPPRSRSQVQPKAMRRSGRLLVNQRPKSQSTRTAQPFQQVMEDVQVNQQNLVQPNVPQTEGSSPELDQTRQPSATPMEQQPTNFREAMHRRAREYDSHRESRRDRGSTQSSERPRGQEAEQRVVGKSSFSDKGGDQKGKGGQQDREGSNHWQGNKLKGMVLNQNLKADQKGKIHELGQAAFLQNLKQTQASAAKRAPQPTVFSKALLDQIVQYVKILSKVDGEKEMDVSLHEKIFKGLRLRVSTVKSKVDATFYTDSESVRRLFLSQKREMESALTEKGIDVRSINVIMIQRG